MKNFIIAALIAALLGIFARYVHDAWTGEGCLSGHDIDARIQQRFQQGE